MTTAPATPIWTGEPVVIDYWSDPNQHRFLVLTPPRTYPHPTFIPPEPGDAVDAEAFFVVVDEELGICDYGRTTAELRQSITETLSFLYDAYACADPNTLTADAQQLGQTISHNVRSLRVIIDAALGKGRVVIVDNNHEYVVPIKAQGWAERVPYHDAVPAEQRGQERWPLHSLDGVIMHHILCHLGVL